MSDPVSHLKRELLAAAERQQGHTVLAPKGRGRWLERFRAVPAGVAGLSSCWPRSRSPRP